MKPDWVGLWFQIQDERGHSDLVPYYLLDLQGNKIGDFSYHHREMDGAAVMPRIMQSLDLSDGKFVSKPLTHPSVLKRLPLFLKGVLGQGRRPNPNWKELDTTIQEKPKTLSCLLLSERANKTLQSQAKQHKVSANSYLLERLSFALGKHLFQGANIQGSWMFPVNMRGAFPNKGLEGNVVSYVPVNISAQTLDKDIHQQIKTGLQENVHWSNWWVYNIGKWIGLSMMRKLSFKASQKTFWIGSFSDMGDWTPSEKYPKRESYKDCVWMVGLPGSPNNPVGSASYTWFGRRSMSLRIHPSVCRENNKEMTLKVLTELQDRLSKDLSLSSGEFSIFNVPTT